MVTLYIFLSAVVVFLIYYILRMLCTLYDRCINSHSLAVVFVHYVGIPNYVTSAGTAHECRFGSRKLGHSVPKRGTYFYP